MNTFLLILLLLVSLAALLGFLRYAFRELASDGLGHNLPPRSHLA